MSPGDSTVLYRALPIQLKFNKQTQRTLAEFAHALSLSVASGRSFTCLITNDRALQRLNRQFRDHDYATDVLSFPADGEESVGDLAISVERAEMQAREFGHSLVDEVRILMLHGLLHLIGLDHESDRGQMARSERKWRLHFQLPGNLIARSKQVLAS